ncbi:MAG TPA: hypothetical protein VFS24_03000 [Steroidobacteraceae bacterium]|nr:hypothetical protein [Steroidobacteraceae bacterium]
MNTSQPEFSIELTAQELVGPYPRVDIVEVEDLWTLDPLLRTYRDAINDDRLLPPTADEVELDLTPAQIELLLLTGSIGR